MGRDGRPGAARPRTRLGPPGVDVAPLRARATPEAARAGLDGASRDAPGGRWRERRRARAPPRSPCARGRGRARRSRAARLLVRPRRRARPSPRSTRSSPATGSIVFVGKLIASKGVELLLAAFPLVLAREPRARLVIVGFGAFREGSSGSRRSSPRATSTRRARDARRGRARAAAARRVLRRARRTPTPTARPRRACATACAFAGRLDHAELADLLPAAEAMAVTEHVPGGVRDGRGRGRRLRRAAGRRQPLRPRRGRPHARRSRPGGRARLALLRARRRRRSPSSPTRSRAGSAAPEDLRARTREAIVAVTRERYSWDGVARTVIAAAQGELGLPLLTEPGLSVPGSGREERRCAIDGRRRPSPRWRARRRA